jgi:hypothetical protein
MLYLHELRNICKLSANTPQTYRSLLLVAAEYDKEILGEILFKSNYSLSKFICILKNTTQSHLEEDRLIIEAIKNYNEPTDLHLLMLLSKANIPLSIELKDKGLEMNLFEEELNKIIGCRNKIINKNEFVDDPLTKISNIQLN